jgi:hypothetical protein
MNDLLQLPSSHLKSQHKSKRRQADCHITTTTTTTTIIINWKNLEDIFGKYASTELQKTAILGTAPHPEDTNLALNLIQMYFP